MQRLQHEEFHFNPIESGCVSSISHFHSSLEADFYYSVKKLDTIV